MPPPSIHFYDQSFRGGTSLGFASHFVSDLDRLTDAIGVKPGQTVRDYRCQVVGQTVRDYRCQAVGQAVRDYRCQAVGQAVRDYRCQAVGQAVRDYRCQAVGRLSETISVKPRTDCQRLYCTEVSGRWTGCQRLCVSEST